MNAALRKMKPVTTHGHALAAGSAHVNTNTTPAISVTIPLISRNCFPRSSMLHCIGSY